MEIINWIKTRIESISNVVDLGIIISLLTGLCIFLIYIYKFTIMNVIGVPLTLTIDILDIKTTDIIIAFLVILSIFSFYFIYARRKFKKVINTIIFGLILLFILKPFKLELYKVITLELSFISLFLGMSLVIWLLKRRPVELINKIVRNSKDQEKFVVFMLETIYSLVIIACVSAFMANVYLLIPVQRQTINNKIIIYNSNSEYLVAQYKITTKEGVNYIEINDNSLETISKDGRDIKLQAINNVVFRK